MQLARAKQEAAALLARAEARAAALAAGAGRAGVGSDLVDASLRRLSDTAEAAEQPSTLLKRWAGGRRGRAGSGVNQCSLCAALLASPLSSACSPASLLLPPPPLPCPRSLPAHDGGCYGLAFNKAGDLMATGGADKSVKLWDPFTAAHKATLRVGDAQQAGPPPCSPALSSPKGGVAPDPHLRLPTRC